MKRLVAYRHLRESNYSLTEFIRRRKSSQPVRFVQGNLAKVHFCGRIKTMKKVRVMYVITKGDVGGAQKYVADLIHHLNPEEYETFIVSGATGDDLPGYKRVYWLSNDYRPFLFFYNDWMALFELWRLFRRERPDVVHLNSSKAGVIG